MGALERESDVIIICSEEAADLADVFRDELNDFCFAKSWLLEKKLRSTTPVPQALIDVASSCDFALLLLSMRDGRSGDASQQLRGKARVDMYFEYGVLVGALGRERCPVAAGSNAIQGLFPADLKGLNPFTFEECDPFDRVQCKADIQRSMTSIKEHILRSGPRLKKTITFELLSKEQVFEKERGEPKGSLCTEHGKVVVVSHAPVETAYAPARQVRINIDNDVHYIYFFNKDQDGTEKVAILLQMLLLAPFNLSAEDAQTKAKRANAIKTNRSRVIDDLKQICGEGALNIYFLPEEPGLQLCIHNANSPDRATAYLRYERNSYIPLCKYPAQSYRVWHDLRNAIPPSGGKGVFQSTTWFDIYADATFRSHFCAMINLYFPSFGNEVADICFDGVS